MGPAAPAMTELGIDLRPQPICMSRFLGGAMWAKANANANANADSDSSRVAKMEEYVRCLEEERRKIDAFKRELPLCMVILTDVIDALKEQLTQCNKGGSAPASARPVLEQFMPISTTKTTMMAVVEEEDGSGGDGSVDVVSDHKDTKANDKEKMNWMMSAQLWSDNSSDCNTDTYSNSNTNNNGSVGSMRNQDERGCGDADRQSESGNPFVSSSSGGGYKYRAAVGGAFLPFNRALASSQQAPAGSGCDGSRKTDEKAVVPAPPSVPVDLSLFTPRPLNNNSSSNNNNNNNNNNKNGPSSRPAARVPEEYRSSCDSASSKVRTFVPPPSTNNVGHLNSSAVQTTQQGPRKARRCWSPELHRRFVSALQQLGGSQVATPKQIRELMKVDGLTNDEVKSHLQKYRLHTRRLAPAPPSAPGSAAANQTPVVMLGGLWVSSAASAPEECLGSKHMNSASGSPQGPLQLGGGGTRGGGLSFTGVDSSCEEDEEEEDGKSESYSWRGSNNQRLCGEETD